MGWALTVEDIEPLSTLSLVLAHLVPFAKQVLNDILDMRFKLEHVFLYAP